MRPSVKVSAVERIGQELLSRHRFRLACAYLRNFGIVCQGYPDDIQEEGLDYLYSYLEDADDTIISRIMKDLDIHPTATSADPPSSWQSTDDFRLFISHIAKHKDKAIRLREALKPYAINGFVAHEDIVPSSEWQTEIEKALHCMDAMVAIHTEGFSASSWTQQEIGFALGLGKKVISFKFREDPTGFLARYQAIPRKGSKAEEIAEEIKDLLTEDELTRIRLLEAQNGSKPS